LTGPDFPRLLTAVSGEIEPLPMQTIWLSARGGRVFFFSLSRLSDCITRLNAAPSSCRPVVAGYRSCRDGRCAKAPYGCCAVDAV
jgi:hypothetical protein